MYQLLLVLLLAVDDVHAASKLSFSLPLKRIKTEHVAKQGKFSRVLKGNGNFSSVMMNKMRGKANVYTEDDESYFADISFGANAQNLQTVRLLIDTGSPIVWVPGHNCRSTAQNRKNCLDANGQNPPPRPKTYQIHGEQFPDFESKYGYDWNDEVAHAKGVFALDKIWFGTPGNEGATRVDDFKLGVANYINMNDDYGCFGLAAREDEDAEDAEKTSFFLEIIHPFLDRKQFVLFYHHSQDPTDLNGGRITFGDDDHTYCGPERSSVPVVEGETSWKFRIQRVTVKNLVVFPTGVQALSDSGSTDLFLPRQDFVHLMVAIGGHPMNTPDGVQFDWDDPKAKPTIKCDKVEDNLKITLTIGDMPYPIPIQALMYDLQTGHCQIHIVPHTDGNANKPWFLGAPWTLSYCQIHEFNDLENPRIGFARVLNHEQAGRYF